MARLKVTHIVYHLVLFFISEFTLTVSYNNNKLLSGILYLHRITDNRVAGSSLKNLRVFQKLCGRDALDKVHLTTTMWDEVELGVGERRLEELKTEYWKTMISQGAQVARCRNDDDSSKKLVRKIVTFLSINRSAHMNSTSQQILSASRTPPLQPPPVETRQWPSSYSQKKPQRYDTSRRGTPTPQPQVENRQGPSSHSQEKLTHVEDRQEQTVRRGSVKIAKEPEVVNAMNQEADDFLAV